MVKNDNNNALNIYDLIWFIFIYFAFIFISFHFHLFHLFILYIHATKPTICRNISKPVAFAANNTLGFVIADDWTDDRVVNNNSVFYRRCRRYNIRVLSSLATTVATEDRLYNVLDRQCPVDARQSLIRVLFRMLYCMRHFGDNCVENEQMCEFTHGMSE